MGGMKQKLYPDRKPRPGDVHLGKGSKETSKFRGDLELLDHEVVWLSNN